MIQVMIIIPAYNEESSIGKVIEKINQVMKNTEFEYRILVIDDGSEDHTKRISIDKGAEVISNEINLGLAESFRRGVSWALNNKSEVIVNIDADGQYVPEEIPVLIKEVLNGNDLVLGSRFSGHIEQMSMMKYVGNIFFTKVIKSLTKINITDAQTGFRAFNRKIAQIKLTTNYSYTHEQIIRAVREGFKIKEVSVTFNKRNNGKSRLMKNPFQYAFRATVNLLRIYRDFNPLKFFGFLGLCIFFIGFAIGSYFLYLHLTVGLKGHLGLTILMILSILVGLQIVLFGFFADMFRK